MSLRSAGRTQKPRGGKTACSGRDDRKKRGARDLATLGDEAFGGLGGFGGFGEFAGGFDDLLGEEIADAGVVACDGEIGGAKELLFAVAERVANGLLDLGIGDAALAGGFAGDEFEDAVAVFHLKDGADLAGLHADDHAFQSGIGLVEREIGRRELERAIDLKDP